MIGRSSIARLMISTGLIGAAIAIARSFLGPGNMPGELGPPVIAALVAVAVAISATGRVRRFSLGMAMTWLLMSIGVRYLPNHVRSVIFLHSVSPILDLTCPNELSLTGFGVTGLNQFFNVRTSREPVQLGQHPFLGVRRQTILAFVEAPLAILGGLILERNRQREPRRANPSGPSVGC